MPKAQRYLALDLRELQAAHEKLLARKKEYKAYNKILEAENRSPRACDVAQMEAQRSEIEDLRQKLAAANAIVDDLREEHDTAVELVEELRVDRDAASAQAELLRQERGAAYAQIEMLQARVAELEESSLAGNDGRWDVDEATIQDEDPDVEEDGVDVAKPKPQVVVVKCEAVEKKRKRCPKQVPNKDLSNEALVARAQELLGAYAERRDEVTTKPASSTSSQRKASGREMHDHVLQSIYEKFAYCRLELERRGIRVKQNAIKSPTSVCKNSEGAWLDQLDALDKTIRKKCKVTW